MAINEEVYKNLGLKGFLGALPERIYKHLGSLGHVGTISDRLFKEGGYLSYITNLLGVVSRYFVTLDPVLNSYYEVASPITLTGDFEIEVEFSTTMTSYGMIIGKTANSRYLAVNPSGVIRLQLNTSINGTTNVRDGKLHTCKLIRTSGVVQIFIDGVLNGSLNDTGVIIFDRVGRWNQDSFYFNGIIANVKFTDQSSASDVVTTFKLDQATANTESSIEGNNSVDYINIPQSAREVYTLDIDTWTGGENVTNGDFATASDWNILGTISNGRANIINQARFLSQNAGLRAGKSYNVYFEYTETSASELRVNTTAVNGAQEELLTNISGTGSGVITGVVIAEGPYIAIEASSALFTGSIDNVSVKEVVEVSS